ncbi:integrase [Streptomyces albidoflavus]|nr:integrase [Streptomyces albidoflavus]
MKELAAGGVPVTVACRVLKLARQPYYRWLGAPVTGAEFEEAYRANALFAAHRDDPEFGYRFLADEAPQHRSGDGGPDRVADLPGQPVVERVRQEAWPNKEGGPAGPRRPREPHLHRDRSEPPVAHRHLRISHRRGQAVSLRGQGRLQQRDRGLLHRRPDEVPPGRDRPGKRCRPAPGRHRMHPAQRQRIAISIKETRRSPRPPPDGRLDRESRSSR